MAKKKLAQAKRTQLVSEKILGTATILLVFLHMFSSFSRHFFSPENMIYYSRTMTVMLTIDKWLGLVIVLGFLLYLLFTKMFYPETWYRIRNAFKRCFCKELAVLLALFVYFILVCVIHSTKYTNVFKLNDLWLFDFMISCMILLPMASLIGYKNMKKIADLLLHVIMLLSTGFILWALWNLFHLNIVTLPNGLQLGMKDDYRFYAGVNENIGAGIGMTMVMIALYMALTHRGIIRIIYSICVFPHFYATLLTGSRGHYVALFISLTLLSFMIVWNITARQKKVRRIVFSCAAALLTAGVMWWLYKGVFTIFESITHLGEYMNIDPTPRAIDKETGRMYVWTAAIRLMVSSPRVFFFGLPFDQIPMALDGTGWFAHAHNMILQMGLLTGVPGMIAFLAFLVMMAVRSIKVGIGKKTAEYPGAYVIPIAVLAFVIANVFEPFLLFYFSIMGCVFFLFCGLIIAIDRGVE